MSAVPRPESARVHTWFELSYSNYLVLPRTLMQSMPDGWQHRIVGCLEELREAYRNVEQAPGYEVTPVRWTYVNELSDEALPVAGVTCEERDGETYYWDRHGSEIESHESVGVPVDEPVPHYNRGRAYVEPRIVAGDGTATGPAEVGRLQFDWPDADGWADPSTWKPEVARVVEAMGYFDWTGFDPADRGHRAMLAAVALNESDMTLTGGSDIPRYTRQAPETGSDRDERLWTAFEKVYADRVARGFGTDHARRDALDHVLRTLDETSCCDCGETVSFDGGCWCGAWPDAVMCDDCYSVAVPASPDCEHGNSLSVCPYSHRQADGLGDWGLRDA